jgi:alanine racemase
MPEAILENSLKLQTAFSLYSEVVAVKKVKKGEFVGYGASFVAESDMNIATLAIGYYDGMKDSMKYVFIGGKMCRIVGSLCMDMTHVEVPEGTSAGDVAEIFGENISVLKVARNAGTSAYKLLTGITSRVPRCYGEEEFYL